MRELHCIAPNGRVFCAKENPHLAQTDGHGGNWPARYAFAQNPREWLRLKARPDLKPCQLCDQRWKEVGQR